MIGFLSINKPKGIFSSKVVGIVKHKLNVQHVGHMGTLDPLASGVLVVAVGKATRMFDYFGTKFKEYVATFTFGYETTTLDSEGEVINRNDAQITSQDILHIIPKFIKQYDQVPPLYSAKSVNGIRAYKLARAGQNVELKPKRVEIYDLQLKEQVAPNTFKIYIKCSSGTYIRSLVRDMALELNTYGTMTDLVRVASGPFSLEKSVNIDDITPDMRLYSVLEVFDNFTQQDIDKDGLKTLLDGKKLPTSKEDGLVLIVYQGECVGVGEIHEHLLKLKTYLREE